MLLVIFYVVADTFTYDYRIGLHLTNQILYKRPHGACTVFDLTDIEQNTVAATLTE